MPTQPLVRIGARGSKLSRAQSGQVQRRIAAALGVPPEEAEVACPLVIISTTGDRVQDRRLQEIGGKGLFTKEIEEALLDGRIDCAVHSMKDMPAQLPAGLCIAASPEREDTRDAFLSHSAERLEELAPRARLAPPACAARPSRCTTAPTSTSSCCAATSTPASPSSTPARWTPSCSPMRG